MEAENDAAVKKIQERVFPTLLKGLTVICKEKPEDPVRYLAHWLIDNNPYRPRNLEEPPKKN